MNVFVLTRYEFFEGEEKYTNVGVFAEFRKVMQATLDDEHAHVKRWGNGNLPSYTAQEFLLDGKQVTAYTRYPNGQWAVRCLVCAGVGRVSDNKCSACGGEGCVKLASEEAQRAYLSASADWQVPRE